MKSKVFGVSALVITVGLLSTAMRAKAAEGRASTLGDIARNPDGTVLRMNQYDADKYCQAQGTRLPTIREMAAYSQSLGAKGILETAYPGVYYAFLKVDEEIKRMNTNGYDAIYTSNSAGETTVDFYFNYSGYQRPSGDLGNYAFWSSSVVPHASSDVYGLVGASGDLYFYDRSQNYNDNAVRCVR